MISADLDEIALVESTQAGIMAVAGALGLPAGAAVLTSDCEFLATVVPWRSLASAGVTTVGVPHRGGAVDLRDLQAVIGRSTRVVSISACQEVSGACVDLAALAEICRARGLVSVIDGAQFVGPRTIDVKQTPIDVLSVGGHKWLLSPFGLGFLYVRRELLVEIEPALCGYMALDPSDGDLLSEVVNGGASTSIRMRRTKNARKFENGGTGAYLAASALAASLQELQQIGLQAIESRVADLCEQLYTELSSQGCTMATPERAEERAGIVTFSTGSVERDRALHQELTGRGVGTSLRYRDGVGGIRVAPYFYSDESDVEALMHVVAQGRSV